MPKISVIMGIYNCKNYELLNKSVDSILNQSFSDFEFIICNDGSTNDTLSELYKISKRDTRIKILSYDKNHGLNYALNYCLQYATGEYIARQDDDDISHPLRFEKQIHYLENNNGVSIVGTIADVFDDSGIWGEYKVPENPTKKDFYWNSPFMHPTIMIRKKAYDAVNGYRIAKETRRCEDIDLFMRMYAKEYIGHNIQEKLYQYRMVNDPNVKYRSMKYRIDETVVKLKGYNEMGILGIKGLAYSIKPILVGLIPSKMLYLIKKKIY